MSIHSHHDIYSVSCCRSKWVQSSRKKKENAQIRKEEVKLSLFTDDMLMYTENSKEATRKLLAYSRTKVYNTRSTHKNYCISISINEHSEMENLKIQFY